MMILLKELNANVHIVLILKSISSASRAISAVAELVANSTENSFANCLVQTAIQV